MTVRIPVVEKITKANDQVAELNRKLLDEHGILGLNILASPGAGKTTMIERTIPLLADTLRIGVIEGDLATSRYTRVALEDERMQVQMVPVEFSIVRPGESLVPGEFGAGPPAPCVEQRS